MYEQETHKHVKGPLLVAGILFTLFALLHIYRLLTDMPIILGDTLVPRWASIVGLIVAGGMAIWLFSVCCCCCSSCKTKNPPGGNGGGCCR